VRDDVDGLHVDIELVKAIPPAIPTTILSATDSRLVTTRRPRMCLFKERYPRPAPGLRSRHDSLACQES
jgi:hypothetical protein